MQPTFYRVGSPTDGWFAVMGRPIAGEYADEEFAALANAGFSSVVSFLEASEAFELGLAAEAELCSRAGIGRSGLLAAAVLLHHGLNAEDAFSSVSNARGLEVPDTPEQVQWLNRHERTIRSGYGTYRLVDCA